MKKLITLLLSLSFASPAIATDFHNEDEWKAVGTNNDNSKFYVSENTTINRYILAMVLDKPQFSSGYLPNGKRQDFLLGYILLKGFVDCENNYKLTEVTETYDTLDRLVDIYPNPSKELMVLKKEDKEMFCSGR